MFLQKTFTHGSVSWNPSNAVDESMNRTKRSRLGVKGIGEAGTIAATASIINAITDALSPLGIKHVDMPATPDRLWKMIKEASK